MRKFTLIIMTIKYVYILVYTSHIYMLIARLFYLNMISFITIAILSICMAQSHVLENM